MIFSQIKPWDNSEVIPQISTYWEIATDESFNNIIETKTTTGNDLYFFTSELSVPELTTYYVRATRQFTNADANILLAPKPVSNIDSLLTNNIIHRDSVKIDKPFIYINKVEFENNDFPDFEVRTSEFRCKQDGHVATNWIVTDIEGNIIFKSLYDNYDKLAKRFDKTNDLLNKTNVIFYVSHVSTNGIESETSKYVLSNENFDFDIVGLFEDIPPYRELKLYVSPLEALQRDISSIWLKKVNERGEISKSIAVTPRKGSNEIIIPGEELSYGTQLYLDVYGVNSNKEQSMKRYKLSVQKVSYTGSLVDHTYERKFQEYNPANYRSLSLPNNFIVSEIPNGNVLIPTRSGGSLSPNIYKTSYRSTENGPVIEIDFNDYGKQQDVVLSSSLIDGVVFKMLNDNLLLIENSKEVGGTPRPSFRIYSYDIVNNEFSLLHEKTREDETTTLGSQNGFVQINRDVIWYMPVGLNVIKEYNFTTNEISTVTSLSGDFRLGTMFFNRRVGKVGLINSTGNMFSIDVDTRQLVESDDVPYSDWIGQRLKVVELLNGDSLFINYTDMSKTSSLVYYDAIRNEYSEILDSVTKSYYHVGVIVTRSFSVYVINREVDGNQDLLINRLY